MAIGPNQTTIPGVGHKIATIAGQVGNERATSSNRLRATVSDGGF